jgi:tRNA(Ile)-lysidine synthase
MNLSRRAGVNGLSGIPQKNGKIIRPLLSYEKKVLCDFVDRIGLPFKNDCTNSDISIPRNFIRQKVLKPWELQVPSLIKGFYKSSLLISEWKQSLDQLLIKFIISKLIISDSRIDIPLNLINDLPNLVKIRLIQLLFDQEKKLWSKHDLRMLEQFLKKVSVGKTFNLINQWSLLHDRGLIIAKKNSITYPRVETYIRPNKTVFFSNVIYQIIINENHAELSNSKNQELVDWSKFKNKKLKIRIWKEGDVFQPLGMKNKKKISDFLINEKIDSFSKKTQSVLTVDGEIAWVCGLRISEWAKITRYTKQKALLTFKPIK